MERAKEINDGLFLFLWRSLTLTSRNTCSIIVGKHWCSEFYRTRDLFMAACLSYYMPQSSMRTIIVIKISAALYSVPPSRAV